MADLAGPELLAPAGNYESFLCAVNAGADAVYLAGKSFGARAYAGNFPEDELLRALDYAHLNGRKVYITINTLFKEDELEGLHDFLMPYYREGLDGVIVQDFGVLSRIKREFPMLSIHASTQMTVTSSYGAKELLELGVKRVVPARELTLEEVKQILKTGIETECFIHGALCYCYSGQCLFSSVIGARSGNRGRCAQPCRLPYENAEGKSGHYLSLKDLCTIEYLPELIRAGISSFKIEGRMKKPAYVYKVTELYHRYIEEYLCKPDGEYRVRTGDRKLLEHFYVRSGVGKGYYEGKRGGSMITMESPAYTGSDEERISEIVDRFGKETLTVSLKGTAVFKAGEPCKLDITSPREYSFIGPICEEARKAPLSAEDIKVRLKKTGDTLFVFEELEVIVDGNVFLPVSALNEFRRNALEEYRRALLEGIRREMDELLPEDRNEIEEYRENKENKEKENYREIEEYKENKEYREKEENRENEKNRDDKEYGEYKGEQTSYIVFIKTKEQLEVCLTEPNYNEIAVPLSLLKDEKIRRQIKESGKIPDVCMPEIIRENETAGASFIRTDLCKIIKEVYINKIYVNQLDSFYFCKEFFPEAALAGDIHFYQMNQEAVRAFEGKLKSFTLPLELNKEELKHLKGQKGELMVYGRIPLMNAYNCIRLTDGKCGKKEGFTYLKDRKGAKLPVFCHCSEKICYNTIYNSVPTCLTRYGQEIREIGTEALQIRFTDEAPDTVKEILEMFQGFALGGERIAPSFPYTNGHFARGIE